MATLRLFNSFSKWESVTHTLKTMLVLVQCDLSLVLFDMCFTLLLQPIGDKVTNWFTYNSIRDLLQHTVNGSVWLLSWIYIAEIQWCMMIVQRRPSSADKLFINWWGSMWPKHPTSLNLCYVNPARKLPLICNLLLHMYSIMCTQETVCFIPVTSM